MKQYRILAEVLEVVNEYDSYKEKVRNGHIGKTATLWIQFLDDAQLTFDLIEAVKLNNLSIYHNCMSIMASLCFAFGLICFIKH